MKGGLERWTEKLGSAVSALGATAVSQAQVLGKKLQQEALGAQCLLDYAVSPQPVATGGASGLWRIHTARSKKEGECIRRTRPHLLAASELGCPAMGRRQLFVPWSPRGLPALQPPPLRWGRSRSRSPSPHTAP